MDNHTRWVELFVDLFGMPNHPFVRDLPSLLPGLLKAGIEDTLKLRFLDGGTLLMGLKSTPFLSLDLLLIRHPIAKLLVVDFELTRGVLE